MNIQDGKQGSEMAQCWGHCVDREGPGVVVLNARVQETFMLVTITIAVDF